MTKPSESAPPGAPDPTPPSGKRRLLRHTAYLPLVLMLAAMPAIPAFEFLGRRFFGTGISGANDYLQHLTLWIAFVGAIFTGFAGEHLQMEVLRTALPERMRLWIDILIGAISTVVCLALAGASLQLVVSEAPPLPEPLLRWLPSFIVDWLEPFGLTHFGSLTLVAGWMPVWIAESVMPVGFLLLAVAFLWRVGPGFAPRAAAAVAAVVFLTLLLLVPHWGPGLRWPLLTGLLLTLPLGTPIFILLGGAALILFWGEGVTAAAIPAETYRIVTSPVFPTIPLFTLCGFLLSESHADRRLVRLFRAWFGWLPGGTAVAITLLCAFVTTFTGASGVTILALGGLLLPVLLQNGYEERFSVGLLTATGSIGLLFPPSLVVILYAVIAQVPVPDMFIAGILPGLLLVGAVSLYCIAVAARSPALERARFEPREAARALWAAKWELAIPPLILVLLFGGICTLVEAAALTVLYAFLAETLIHRDLGPAQLLALLRRCGRLLGGLLIILGVAMGLTSYLVDAEVPAIAAQWAEAHIHSRWMFLLFLNLVLIAVGCLMDIFSALIVVVPILLPVAAVFEVDPIHLGVIFMVNLELGYLTPPVGMNLFLASFRFKRPLPRLYRDALPFLLIRLIVVLLVTFLSALSLAPVRFLR